MNAEITELLTYSRELLIRTELDILPTVGSTIIICDKYYTLEEVTWHLKESISYVELFVRLNN